jgi:hypothetical protein
MQRFLYARLLLTVGLRVGGCATTEEWRIWREHSAHFASGDHWKFSFRKADAGDPHVTSRDFVLARAQTWWGRPITVSQDQIIAR